MSRLLPILILGAITMACQNNSQEDQTATEEIPMEETKAIQLEKFTLEEWPEAIDGCSCSFVQEGDADTSFIYVDDYQHMAFIKINGTMQQMELVDISKNEDELIQNCQSEQYNINIEMKKTKTIDELNLYKGQMTIKRNTDGTESSYQINGACGC